MVIRKLLQPIDIAPLIVFRVFLGFLLFAETFGAICTGWVTNVMIKPAFTFSHIGFEWLQPLPGNGMYFYFLTMSVLGLGVMAGYKYRWSLGLFTILWAGAYLMQKESYNNHYYLLLLVCFIMLFLPANRYCSIDAKAKPEIRQAVMPQWCSWVMILQIAIVYVFAVVSKLYPQWLDGTFIRLLLGRDHHPAFLKGLFSQSWFHLFISWSGIFFDLLIVPMLLWKKTRNLAFLSSLLFHLFNAVVLQIGIFPFFALSFVVFFYPPETIRKLFFKNKPVIESATVSLRKQSAVLYFLAVYFVIQLLLPLRHFLIEGDVLWTEEGHRLSWRMMLRQRDGHVSFRIVDHKSGTESYYDYSKLTPKQQNFIATKPDGIWQMTQRIKKEYAAKGQKVSIFVHDMVSVNGGEYATFIDPKTDFALAQWNTFSHNDWILLYENHK